MSGDVDPQIEVLQRRLSRERAARGEAEQIAEQGTRELYETVRSLTALKLVLDETTDFVAVFDRDGSCLYVNRMLQEFFGIDMDALAAFNVLELLSPQSRARYVDETEPALRQKGVWRGEFALFRPDGGEMAVSVVLIAHRLPDGSVEQISAIARDVTEQHALHERLALEALHDPLTGLANRRLLFDRLDLAQARCSRAGTSLGIAFLDLDDFKGVNDTYGHDAGDQVLVTIAERLRAHVRGTDTLARFGGDEFMVVCEDVGTEQAVVEVAGRLTRAVAEPIDVDGAALTLTASVGVATAQDMSLGLEELLRRADIAMYRAKAAGGNRSLLFDPTIEDAP